MRIRITLVVVMLVAGCSQDDSQTGAAPQPGDFPAAAARAQEALVPFKQSLMQALKQGMSEGGPVTAIDKCQLEAPVIAATLSTADIHVGRSSHKLRNPGNAPTDWQQAAIDHYLANPEDRAPQTYSLAKGLRGYVEPIIAQPLCLACHGTNLSPDVSKVLAEKYPHDQATGFKEGELRGIFWVTLPAEPAN